MEMILLLLVPLASLKQVGSQLFCVGWLVGKSPLVWEEEREISFGVGRGEGNLAPPHS